MPVDDHYVLLLGCEVRISSSQNKSLHSFVVQRNMKEDEGKKKNRK